MTLIEQIFRTSDVIKNARTPLGVMNHTMSELGELAEEVLIHQGQSYKSPGEDGILGEAVDTIICILDLIRITYPDVSEQELQKIAELKLKKWVVKTNG
jgi:NTP pyrophosphatase (non-canonical NTP hydrolase)